MAAQGRKKMTRTNSQDAPQYCHSGHTPLIDLYCRFHILWEDLASFPSCRCLKASVSPGQRPQMILNLFINIKLRVHLVTRHTSETGFTPSHSQRDGWPVRGDCSTLYTFSFLPKVFFYVLYRLSYKTQLHESVVTCTSATMDFKTKCNV